jgi:alpha-beta hydrolase superfamily lysophospholipase
VRKPIWFGPDERPLFGWLYVPEDGRARGTVLLCPTLGIEAVTAKNTYRSLADRLVEAGFVTLRFDYDGTGDSAGEQGDPDRLEAWLSSIRVATEFLKNLHVGRTSVVGIRVGATLVAEVFGQGPATVDDVVLWDPCATGRAFLREQRALWSFTDSPPVEGDGVMQGPEEGSIQSPGLVFQKETVAELSALAIADRGGPLAARVLLLMRSSRKGDRKMNERLAMTHTERVGIQGQENLIDVDPNSAIVPTETLELIVTWLSTTPEHSSPVDVHTVDRNRAIVGTSSSGVAIEEMALSIGPIGLFGIVTSPSFTDEEVSASSSRPADLTASPSSRLPTIFFFNPGMIDHVGPGRLWVELGRAWAKDGFRVVRFDLSGLGDSPVRAGQSPYVIYAPEAVEDVRDALNGILPDDPSNAILIGHCSGAYQAIEVGLDYKVRSVCAINPEIALSPAVEVEDWAQSLTSHDRLASLARRLPAFAWWIINRTALGPPPPAVLVKVVDAGVDIFVIVGKSEAHMLQRGERWMMRKLSRSERFRIDVVPELEHSLFDRSSSEYAAKLLGDYIDVKYASNAPRLVKGDPSRL